jgi:hypothetical protein
MPKLLSQIIIGFVGYHLIVGVMTQYEVAKFTDSKLFWARPSQLISVMDLAATSNVVTSSVAVLCPGITSSRGYTSLSDMNNGDKLITICCDTQQWLVPFKDVGDRREYLCGKWPHSEVVTQPLSNTKIILNS